MVGKISATFGLAAESAGIVSFSVPSQQKIARNATLKKYVCGGAR
jgi:hypothetical protein